MIICPRFLFSNNSFCVFVTKQVAQVCVILLMHNTHNFIAFYNLQHTLFLIWAKTGLSLLGRFSWFILVDYLDYYKELRAGLTALTLKKSFFCITTLEDAWVISCWTEGKLLTEKTCSQELGKKEFLFLWYANLPFTNIYFFLCFPDRLYFMDNSH